jgi:segregation and condensation protein B
MTTNKKKPGPRSKAKKTVESDSIDNMDAAANTPPPVIEEESANSKIDAPDQSEQIGEPEWIYATALAGEDPDALNGDPVVPAISLVDDSDTSAEEQNSNVVDLDDESSDVWDMEGSESAPNEPVDANSEPVSETPPPASAVIEEIDLRDEDEEEPKSIESEIEDETAYIEELPEESEFKTIGEIKAAIECLLFTTPHPLSHQRLKSILGSVDLKTLRGAVAQVQMEYDARESGLQIMETSEGFQMCTRPEHANVVLRLHRQRKRNPLTVTALETLAIVAYKQPITRAEIEMIRGVESSGVLRNLLDMGIVKVVGRKEIIGRPQLYGTTSIFLKTFGLKTVADLPTLQQLRRQYVEPSRPPVQVAVPEEAPEASADLQESPNEAASEPVENVIPAEALADALSAMVEVTDEQAVEPREIEVVEAAELEGIEAVSSEEKPLKFEE